MLTLLGSTYYTDTGGSMSLGLRELGLDLETRGLDQDQMKLLLFLLFNIVLYGSLYLK